MTTSPAGTWVSKADSGTTLDVQNGGSLKLTKQGAERMGTWKLLGKSAIEVSLDGVTATCPFTRKDLTLSITLPGESSPSEFVQM